MKRTGILTIAILMLSTLTVAADPIDIEQFLHRVEAHSKDLKLARQELRTADANKREALSGALPHLSASAGYNRNLNKTYMYVDLGEGTTKMRINRDNEYSANIVLGQTLFNGTVYNAVKAANQYKKMSNLIYDASHQEIVTYAKKAFYQTLLLKVVWEVSQASEQNAYDNYTDIKKAYESGLTSEFALLQAEVRHKDLVPQTTEAERNYKIALINVKNLAGIPVEEDISLHGGLDTFPNLPERESLETILKSRPDFNALLWQERLYNTGVSAERSGYLPSLSGSLTYAFSSQSNEWSFDEKNEALILGVNLSFPIFSGGATRAKVQKAKIERDKAGITVDKTREDIEREIESIRLRLEESYNRIISARATLKAAEKAFAIAEATSHSGLSTQLELKDSRVMLDQATTGYYSAVYEYLDAFFDWEKAIGKVNSDG